MSDKAYVAGVHMVKFAKPGQNEPYRVMASKAINGALEDAGIGPEHVQQAFASYIYGFTGSGQHALYDAFQTGIPLVNVSNACASGSSAIFLARQLVEAGALDCVLAFGFDEMPRGAIEVATTHEYSGERIENLLDARGVAPAPVPIARWFGAAGEQYMEKYDATPDLFAKVSVKSRRHAANNPYALLTTPITEDEVLNSPLIYGDYMTRFMACPPTCGAAAALIVSEGFARHHNLPGCIEITAQSLTTDTEQSWDDPILAIGSENVQRAANEVYEIAGIGPEDVDVVELHDCFTPNEVIAYEGLGLCGEGEATRFVANGDNTFGGQVVVNPSGGLMSKGHPIGATGLAQCCELTWQLRGTAGDRQVPDAGVALQHNIGLVAAAAVTMYRPAAF
jgi:acetyl-CoA acetyltransferase